MGKKAEAGSQKWLANKMKSRGLMKLKFYCQACEKQCRDQNGFKCHLTSKSHLENMKRIAEQGVSKHIDGYSSMFEESFMQLLSTRYCGSGAVLSNEVYQDFIRDRDHVHMNATMWESLTEFVRYLEKEGKVLVTLDPRERIMIEYVNTDAGAKRIKEEIARKKRKVDGAAGAAGELEAEEERMRLIVAAGGGVQASSKPEDRGEKFDRGAFDSAGGVAGLGGFGAKSQKTGGSAGARNTNNVFAQFAESAGKSAASAVSSTGNKRAREDDADSASDGAADDDASHSHDDQPLPWVREGLVVKVLDETLGDPPGKYFKKKGRVFRVNTPQEGTVGAEITADLRMLDPEEGTGGSSKPKHKKLRIGQQQLQTVIPKPGGGRHVMLCNAESRYCGVLCELVAVLEPDAPGPGEDEGPISAQVRIVDVGKTGAATGKTMHVDLDDICRWEATDPGKTK